MTEFDAILQRTLGATTEKMILMLGVLLVIVIVSTIRFIFVMKKLRTESMSNQDYERLMKRKRALIFSICLSVLGLIVIPIGNAQRITRLKNDIDNQQYICAEVDYSHSRKGTGEEVVSIVKDGERIFVHFPQGWSEKDFRVAIFTVQLGIAKKVKFCLASLRMISKAMHNASLN